MSDDKKEKMSFTKGPLASDTALAHQLYSKAEIGFVALMEIRGHMVRPLEYTSKTDGKTKMKMEFLEVSAEFVGSGMACKLELSSPRGQERFEQSFLDSVPKKGTVMPVSILSLSTQNGISVAKVAAL